MIDLRRICNLDVCLNRSVSCEFGVGVEWKKKFRKRRCSVLVLGIGVMLFKVVCVLDFGLMVMRRLFKVGFVEIIFGVEVL